MTVLTSPVARVTSALDTLRHFVVETLRYSVVHSDTESMIVEIANNMKKSKYENTETSIQ